MDEALLVSPVLTCTATVQEPLRLLGGQACQSTKLDTVI